MSKSMRAAIMKKASSDPQGVMNALQSTGAKPTSEEMAMIKAGQFSEELSNRFNAKVMGMLGMEMESMDMKQEKMNPSKMDKKKMDMNQ